MSNLQMTALSSFVYLIDQVPGWLDQLSDLSTHAAQKNTEFVAEWTNLVDKAQRKRRQPASLQSLHSDKSRSSPTHTPQTPHLDSRTDLALPTPPDPVDIDPLEAGNKYLYAQANRKRKPTSSVRSGASGPQRFRSKNQVVIYYDSHVQTQLDSLVKSIGLARNNLRKGRNAHSASEGFSLPILGRKADLSLVPSLDSLRSNPVPRSNVLVSTSKYPLRSSPQQPSNPADGLFTAADKILETASDFCQTAAYQFLRDGDCKTELDSAASHLATVLTEARQSADKLRQKAEEQKDILPNSEGSDNAAAAATADSASDISQQTPPISFDHLHIAQSTKYGPILIPQTLQDIKNTPRSERIPPTAVTAPVKDGFPNLPTMGMEIEVDDDSDDGSIGVIDMSQFRAAAGRRLRLV